MKKIPAAPAAGASLMATIETDAVEYNTLRIIPLQANMIAVMLHGVFKDNSQAICKHKAKEAFRFPDEIHWSPYRSCAFCSIPDSLPITTLIMIRTFAVPIHATTTGLSNQVTDSVTSLKEGLVMKEEENVAMQKEGPVTQEDVDKDVNNEDAEDKDTEDEDAEDKDAEDKDTEDKDVDGDEDVDMDEDA